MWERAAATGIPRTSLQARARACRRMGCGQWCSAAPPPPHIHHTPTHTRARSLAHSLTHSPSHDRTVPHPQPQLLWQGGSGSPERPLLSGSPFGLLVSLGEASHPRLAAPLLLRGVLAGMVWWALCVRRPDPTTRNLNHLIENYLLAAWVALAVTQRELRPARSLPPSGPLSLFNRIAIASAVNTASWKPGST